MKEKETITVAASQLKEFHFLKCSAALKKRFQDLFIEYSSKSRDLSRRSPGRKQLFQSMDMNQFPRDRIITILNVFDPELIKQSLVNINFSISSCSSHCLLNVCFTRLFFKLITNITLLGLFKRKVQNVTWMQATKSCVLRMWL